MISLQSHSDLIPWHPWSHDMRCLWDYDNINLQAHIDLTVISLYEITPWDRYEISWNYFNATKNLLDIFQFKNFIRMTWIAKTHRVSQPDLTSGRAFCLNLGKKKKIGPAEGHNFISPSPWHIPHPLAYPPAVDICTPSLGYSPSPWSLLLPCALATPLVTTIVQNSGGLFVLAFTAIGPQTESSWIPKGLPQPKTYQ